MQRVFPPLLSANWNGAHSLSDERGERSPVKSMEKGNNAFERVLEMVVRESLDDQSPSVLETTARFSCHTLLNRQNRV